MSPSCKGKVLVITRSCSSISRILHVHCISSLLLVEQSHLQLFFVTKVILPGNIEHSVVKPIFECYFVDVVVD